MTILSPALNTKNMNKSFLVLTLLIVAAVSIMAQENPEIPFRTLSTVTTHYQYDALNRPTNIYDSRGYRTIVKYDPVGNIIRKQTFEAAKVIAPTNVVIRVSQTNSIPFMVTHLALPLTDIKSSLLTGLS